MAQYVDFPQANQLMQGDGGAIGDLRVFADGTQFVSCWELSDEEILDVIKTKRVFLFILGDSHPPVHVQGSDPFAGPPGQFVPAVDASPATPEAREPGE